MPPSPNFSLLGPGSKSMRSSCDQESDITLLWLWICQLNLLPSLLCWTNLAVVCCCFLILFVGVVNHTQRGYNTGHMEITYQFFNGCS